MDSLREQEVVLLIALGVAIMTALGLSMVLFYYQTRRKLLNEALKHQRLLLEKTILTQERERKRIAKDLHDEVGGKLNVAHLYLQHLRNKTPDDAEALEVAEGITSALNSAIGATRRISHDLLPPILEEFGLERALHDLAGKIRASRQLAVEVEVSVKHFPIASPTVELNIFRIIQEFVSNSIKHGAAQQLSIRLAGDRERLDLHYADDGRGIQAEDQEKPHGLGLRNIESRLQIINGSWQFSAPPGQGFRADLTINTAA